VTVTSMGAFAASSLERMEPGDCAIELSLGWGVQETVKLTWPSFSEGRAGACAEAEVPLAHGQRLRDTRAMQG
jgi:hypothetical protein